MGQTYIYALKEVGSEHVRYVGQSISPETRFKSHLHSGNSESEHRKERWIGDVLGGGGNIEMKIIEQCAYEAAKDRENYWMDHYRLSGHDLTNHDSGKKCPVTPRSSVINYQSVPMEDDMNDWEDEALNTIEFRLQGISIGMKECSRALKEIHALAIATR